MARNKTLLTYNGTRQDQDWSIYCEGTINERFTLGQVRKSFTVALDGDAVLQFGVGDTVYLRATYNYNADSWTHHTDTPNEFSFATAQSGITVTSSYSA